jgi:hypothetical protein
LLADAAHLSFDDQNLYDKNTGKIKSADNTFKAFQKSVFTYEQLDKFRARMLSRLGVANFAIIGFTTQLIDQFRVCGPRLVSGPSFMRVLTRMKTSANHFFMSVYGLLLGLQALC